MAFVDQELAKRVSVPSLPVGGNFSVGKFLRTRGVGLTVEEVLSIDPGRVVTVGPSNCAFTSIQAAINSVPLNTATYAAPYTILIYSGTYQETIVPRQFINLVGVGVVRLMCPPLLGGATFNQFDLQPKTETVQPGPTAQCVVNNIYFGLSAVATDVGYYNFILGSSDGTNTFIIMYFNNCELSIAATTVGSDVLCKFITTASTSVWMYLYFRYCMIAFSIAKTTTLVENNAGKGVLYFYYSNLTLSSSNASTGAILFSAVVAAFFCYMSVGNNVGAGNEVIFAVPKPNGYTCQFYSCVLYTFSTPQNSTVFIDTKNGLSCSAAVYGCLIRLSRGYYLKDNKSSATFFIGNTYDIALTPERFSPYGSPGVRNFDGPSDIVTSGVLQTTPYEGRSGSFSRSDHRHGYKKPIIFASKAPTNPSEGDIWIETNLT